MSSSSTNYASSIERDLTYFPTSLPISKEEPVYIKEGTVPTYKPNSPALSYQLHCNTLKARAGSLFLPHGKVRTPVFMPVGTKGTIKGLSSQQLIESAECPEIILGTHFFSFIFKHLLFSSF